ncbi:hypothetical protein [Nocardia brevicatena]|uniref:hypothetical protein n=1 Tax=Nocardia brevicatena TaxID=37327 RepID=UPI001C3F3179|nr:hypothetical protein [Nocardia brevicatena]
MIDVNAIEGLDDEFAGRLERRPIRCFLRRYYRDPKRCLVAMESRSASAGLRVSSVRWKPLAPVDRGQRGGGRAVDELVDRLDGSFDGACRERGGDTDERTRCGRERSKVAAFGESGVIQHVPDRVLGLRGVGHTEQVVGATGLELRGDGAVAPLQLKVVSVDFTCGGADARHIDDHRTRTS